MNEILHMRNISKSFSGVEVLHGVDLDLFRGEVLALVGENGAGKSTLMKILMGIEQPNAGEIMINGELALIENPARALELGIAMIHQELSPIPEMTVEENMYIGREINRFGFVNTRKQVQKTREWLAKLNIDISPMMKMEELSISKMQMVEIAKAISYDSRILIMDEPTSAITEKEVMQLFELINMLKKDGVSVIYISHKLHELPYITDRVEVMRDGHIISVSRMADISEKEIMRDMVGREISTIYPKCKNKIGDPILEVEQLTKKGEFADISFSLHAGEKLGIAGLMGAGRTELVSAIFGASRADSGRVIVKGKPMHTRKTADAINRRIALVPEDRKLMGLNQAMNVAENTTMCIDRSISKMGFLNAKKGTKLASSMVEKLSIRVHSLRQAVENLSGGNQQKVVLAKWLLTEPEILLFDEPTRGIDVGAKAEIFELINQQVMSGKGVLIISSEMQELVGVADRVLVMCGGRITGELTGKEITQENIMALASPQKEATLQAN
jgi:ABC-type sugar transport system ATPase subunit